MSSSTDQYIEYVEKMISRFKEASSLIHEDSVTPVTLNSALASYMEVNQVLLAEYQRRKMEFLQIEEEYNAWYDDRFEEAKEEVMLEYSETKIKPALKEFETRIRTKFKEEYSSWKEQLRVAEAKMKFTLRYLDMYEKFDRILTTLSQNMRSEMFSLSIENRMNSNPVNNSQNKVRRQFPTRTPVES